MNEQRIKCSHCAIEKLTSCFYKETKSKTGFNSWCKECRKEYRKKPWVREKIKNSNLNWYKRNQANRDKFHSYQRKERYGISEVDFKEMLARQNGVCAICGNAETSTFRGRVKNMCVDHCHETNIVRGLLCGKCNTALGLMCDDTERMANAIVYVEYHKKANKETKLKIS